jgi:hypothetical protein
MILAQRKIIFGQTSWSLENIEPGQFYTDEVGFARSARPLSAIACIANGSQSSLARLAVALTH